MNLCAGNCLGVTWLQDRSIECYHGRTERLVPGPGSRDEEDLRPTFFRYS